MLLEASECKEPMIVMELSSQRAMRIKISVQLIVSSLCAIWHLQDAVAAVGLVERLEHHNQAVNLNAMILLLSVIMTLISPKWKWSPTYFPSTQNNLEQTVSLEFNLSVSIFLKVMLYALENSLLHNPEDNIDTRYYVINNFFNSIQ